MSIKLQHVLGVHEPDLLLVSALAVAVALLVGAAFSLALLAQRLQRRARRGLGELADAALEGLVTCEHGVIKQANAALATLLGVPRDRLRNQLLLSFVPPEHHEYFGKLSREPHETEVLTPDKKTIPVEVTIRDLQDGGIRRVYAFQDIRERRIADARISYLAQHDLLTSLPNRTIFQRKLIESVQRAWASDGQLAVFWLGLDRFKDVNNVFGQAAGDAVLVDATRRISSMLQSDELLARVGGDEFAVLIAPCDFRRANSLAEKLVSVLSEDFAIGNQKADMSASIGIALFPSHGTTADTLFANAQIALQRSKSEGSDDYCFFDSEAEAVVQERRALAGDLAQGLERGELELHFQPQAKVACLAVTGFEALVRWRHRERGYVPPSEFVELAEEHGFVHELGLWVLRRACAEAARWPNPLDVAVNISASQFQCTDLPAQILAILTETGLSPCRLELEITETAFIKDFDRALSMLRRLKSLGLRIAMDDFGTGWSSLSTLQAFPFDRLKIDREFVDGIGYRKQAEVIVKAVLGLGRSLQIPVLAEGVEAEEQLQFLRQEGCEELQGYLFARPGPIERFGNLTGMPSLEEDETAARPALAPSAA